jgi:hypothetical protein
MTLDIQAITRADLTGMVWKDRRRIHSNMHQPPEEGSSRMSMATLSSQQESYNIHMESFDKGDRMAKSCSINWCTFQLTKKQSSPA